ncbi:HTTM domain-containing protein [Halosolutus halophilus]|uniref:HTTM domain-containing protein n=1 Tax=Halosolutus halophilus TaxID=1552990 RepID=UPI002235005F|nr:HTTM domain-containing protein [Halosolutus halophilus]
MTPDRQRRSTVRNRITNGLDRLAAGVQRRFEIDRRALAAFRIALGALLLVDLLRRARKLETFYTDAGVLPREALYSDYSPLYSYSLHAISGEAWVQALLFCVAGVVAVALLVGYRTRIATIVSWVLLISLHLRNPMIINGGDVLFRMLLFWGIFLPLGSRWAVDARRVDRDRQSPTVVSVGTMAVLLQVLLMYVTNAIHKTQSDEWMAGEAVVYIFQADHFTFLLGNVLADQVLLLRAFTYAWMGLILLSPLLLLLTGFGRAAIASLFAGMHLGMLVTLRIDLFPLIVVAGLLLFYPPRAWDGAVAVSARLGIAAPLRRALERLQTTVPVLAVPEFDVPDVDRPRAPSLSAVAARGRVLFATVIPWLLLVLVVLSNGEAVGYTEVPDPGAEILDTLQADQSWRMFAPNPTSTAQWLVVPGELEDGSKVDVLHDSEVDWDRPPNVDTTYDTARERKYVSNMRYADNENHRSYFANYLCERWNRTHETNVETLTVYGMSDRSGPYDEAPDVTEYQLIEYDCSGEFVQRDT